ncbi:pyridoxamine 5'-phosphate oxidase family protein [Rhodoferax sp.]|uniref:pyridoxamine 5'-phosphate oxidase family protein n=1 Tax=Rhodoferax sp. TaxID=50421 RepID=UPI00374D0D47
MKTETQTTPELSRLAELVGGMSVAMLTTEDGHGGLVSQPMAPLELDASGALWFFTDLRSEKVEHLKRVNLSFSDEGRATYVSISGHGEIHDDRQRVEDLWTAFARPWFPDGAESTHLGLLKIVPHTAEFWDAPHSKMVRMFAMAASVVAGKPIALGEHDSLHHLSEPELRYVQTPMVQ